jgi:ATP synthase protein I
MAEDVRPDKPADRPTEEAALSARLRRLGEALDRERTSRPPETDRGRSRAETTGFARGFRLASELVGGVLAGAGVGWALDRTVGTSPFGMIVFLLVGFAAGVVNVVRVARVSGNPTGKDQDAG